MIHSIRLSLGEWRLIEAIRLVGFGDFFNLEIPEEPLERVESVNGCEMAMLTTIRGGGNKFDILRVHDGRPISAEARRNWNGFDVSIKYRFSDPTGDPRGQRR